MEIKYVDKGLREILKLVTDSGRLVARVGVLDPQASQVHPLRNDITIGEVAVINEFGTEHVPRRSYLKRTVQHRREEIRTAMGSMAARIVEGAKPRAELQNFGRRFVGEVKHTIESDVPPPNAPMTIKEKGHDHTLIHTLTLLESISHDVVKRSSEVFSDMYYGDVETRYRSEEYADIDAASGEGT